MAAHALVHWYVHLHLWLWIQTQIDWVFQKFDGHLRIVRLLHWIHIHQTVVLIYPDLYLTLVGLVWCHGYNIHWQFMSIHCRQVSCESNHTVSTYLWISKWTKLCHGNKRHAVCQIHKNTVLCWNAESYVQNAETLCSKCGNTMLKTRKHYAQNAETLFCDIPSHSPSKILNGSLVPGLPYFQCSITFSNLIPRPHPINEE